ncbi:MAG: 2-oxoglutarate oxidoreductase [Chloroflexi bacterium]|nr:2-oxoglutarate oxidoreductase [Candidatus Rokubacteria bacterium]MBI2324300.1 2-oxoglutarate oxidoreductase [Chloroflexota bacterium]
MSAQLPPCLLWSPDDHRPLEEYQTGIPRWCVGCGDNAILAAVQRLCRDESLSPERTVFVSGIGCSSRLPHYMRAYGFHGTHGRALPIAEGVKMARPDLTVFVTTGDGDCLSIGAAHWLHALRYNMDLTVLLHDNHIYGLTKKQVSPTSPIGTRSNTTPKGSFLPPLNPLTVTLGVPNASFVAQAVDWIPEVLYQILSAAYRHKGTSFVRILQRCPEFMPGMFDPWVRDPSRTLLLRHEKALTLSPAVAATYRNQREHDPSDMNAAREIASVDDPIPVGILYHDPSAPRYEEIRNGGSVRTRETIRRGLEAELDRLTIWPEAPAAGA